MTFLWSTILALGILALLLVCTTAAYWQGVRHGLDAERQRRRWNERQEAIDRIFDGFDDRPF